MDKNIFLPDLTPHLQQIKEANDAEKTRQELLKLFAPVSPFSEKEMTPEATKARIALCAGLSPFSKGGTQGGFWYWDKIYFPPESYPGDYAEPGAFHKEIISYTELTDKLLHLVIGPRDTAKTANYKKKFMYDFLFGKRRNMGFGSETLIPAKNFLSDMIHWFETNERIKNDYKIEWLEQGSESIFARSEVNPNGTYISPLSMERSSKGRSRGILHRFDYVYFTDWENKTSSLTKEAVQERILVLNEIRTSLSLSGTFIADGNNFDEDTAQNNLLLQQEKGIGSEYIKVHLYSAWDDKRKGQYKCIWYNRYPAKSETELRKLMKPLDDYDWAGNFQGRPEKQSGDQFPKTNYQEWDTLPDDLRTIIFGDLNCSLKQKGDTTALTPIAWSCKTQAYYLLYPRCRSYFDSDQLLNDYLNLIRDAGKLSSVMVNMMDGNVTQESIWTNNILQYTRIHGFPFPYIAFRKYNVDDLVTSPSAEWKNNKFYFPPGYIKTDEGKEYCKQVFKFRTKKAKKKDDAPDSLISAYTGLIEYGISMLASSSVEIHNVCNRNILKKNRP